MALRSEPRLVALAGVLAAEVFLIAACNVVTELAPDVVRGSGNRVSEERDVEDFTALDVGWGMRTAVTVGPATSVVIEADDNLVSLIDTTAVDGALIVRPTEANMQLLSSGGILLKLSAPSLTAVTLSGGARADVAGINAESFSVSGSGGSRATLTGGADRLGVELSGGSRLLAAELASASAAVEASGGSQAEVAATVSLSVDLSGGSRVCYFGAPSVTADASGGSTVEPCR